MHWFMFDSIKIQTFNFGFIYHSINPIYYHYWSILKLDIKSPLGTFVEGQYCWEHQEKSELEETSERPKRAHLDLFQLLTLPQLSPSLWYPRVSYQITSYLAENINSGMNDRWWHWWKECHRKHIKSVPEDWGKYCEVTAWTELDQVNTYAQYTK